MLPFIPGDVARYLAAVGLFWIVLVPPGLVLGWSTNVFGFRTREPLFRLYAAVALGVSILPILMYLCWSLGSLIEVWILFGTLWSAFLALLMLRRLHLKDLCPPGLEGLLALGWLALTALIVLDLRIGAGLYVNWASIDYSFRSSLIQAIHSTSVLPAHNPFFNPGHLVPFRYHYFWFMLAGFVQTASGGLIGARDALFASVAWSGLAIIAVVALFLEDRSHPKTMAWRRLTWMAAGLMTITGLDLIPDALIALIVSLARHRLFFPFGDFEFWNGDGQVTSWLGSCIWVPNHVGGLVCACTGFLLLLSASRSRTPGTLLIPGLLAGLAFASAAGCSIYVVFVFVVALVGLFFASVLRKRWRLVSSLALAGCAALLSAAPYLMELRQAQQGTPFAVLRPRTFGPVFWFLQGTPATLNAKSATAMLLCLPLNYALELGFFAAIGVFKFKKMRKTGVDSNDAMLLFLLGSGLLIGSFLASVALPHNDLGWRAMLVPQWILLIWAVEWADGVFQPGVSIRAAFRGPSRLVLALGLIGVLGSVCDAALLRFYAVAIDQNRGTSINPDLSEGLGNRTAELRTIYASALQGLPPSALVQESPTVPDAVQQGLYSAWPSSVRGRDYGPAYGGDRTEYARTESALRPVFEQPVPLHTVASLCATTQIGAFVLQDIDPAWRQPASWIWSTQPAFSGNHARAFTCAEILREAARQPPDPVRDTPDKSVP